MIYKFDNLFFKKNNDFKLKFSQGINGKVKY